MNGMACPTSSSRHFGFHLCIPSDEWYGVPDFIAGTMNLLGQLYCWDIKRGANFINTIRDYGERKGPAA
ncbi:hypothetical protein ACTMKN_03860 [Bacteroides pyogenes]|uniref:hypothetical protein n=1 Tax=Bacteroides pyogenes TaxID=310300 RepID=UPI003F9DDE67